MRRKDLAHFGQGKWYPGEQLPRWSLNCFWRAGWRTSSGARPRCTRTSRPDYAPASAHAGEFLTAVASRLGVTSEFVFPTYEDAFYYLWRERRLPTNVDPLDSKLEMIRWSWARLAQAFGAGLDSIIGHVLLIARNAAGWETGAWFLRTERCYLDSRRLADRLSPAGGFATLADAGRVSLSV